MSPTPEQVRIARDLLSKWRLFRIPKPTDGDRALAEGGDDLLDRMRGLGMDRETIEWTEGLIKDARRRVERWPE